MKPRKRAESMRRRELRWAVFGFGALLVLLLVLAQLLAASGARSEPATALTPGAERPRTARERELDLESFDWIWTTIRDKHFDPALGGLDWQAVRDSMRPRASRPPLFRAPGPPAVLDSEHGADRAAPRPRWRRSEDSMPLEYRIDRECRVVFVTATGTLTDGDFFSYQREVWSRSDVAGFDEVVDMGAVEDIAQASGDRVRALADLALAMDVPGAPSRLAIVAPQDFAYGLARMFETYRTMSKHGSKVVSVFRSMQAALDWLDLDRRGAPAGERPPGPPASS